MSGDLLDINGTRLFVDDRGAGATALLYVHGGPGQGAYDFMASVGERLAAHLRVVGVDQRGCLRSDPLPDTPPLTQELLIEDYEAVRRRLDIERWMVVAHSAGGPPALKYALAHPDAVSAVVFVCTTFDADRTDRYRLPVIARVLRERGETEAADRCLEIAGLERRITVEDDTRSAMQALGEAYFEVFFHDRSGIDAYAALYEAAGFTRERRHRGMSHVPLVGAMYEPTLGLLPRLTQPHALINGVDDLVAAPTMVEDYRRTTVAPRVITVPRAGHFPFIEQPEEFVRALRSVLP